MTNKEKIQYILEELDFNLTADGDSYVCTIVVTQQFTEAATGELNLEEFYQRMMVRLANMKRTASGLLNEKQDRLDDLVKTL